MGGTDWGGPERGGALGGWDGLGFSDTVAVPQAEGGFHSWAPEPGCVSTDGIIHLEDSGRSRVERTFR